MAETKNEKDHNWNKHHLDKTGSLIEVCRLALKKVNSYETDAVSDVLLEAMNIWTKSKSGTRMPRKDDVHIRCAYLRLWACIIASTPEEFDRAYGAGENHGDRDRTHFYEYVSGQIKYFHARGKYDYIRKRK